jgi:STAS domain
VSLVVAALTVVTAVALLPLFQDLPQAALGAVVISAVVGFLDLAGMERVRRLRRDSFVIALVAMVAVLALGVLQGLILAAVVSVGEFLIWTSRPSRSVLGRLSGTTTFVARENAPEARTEPGLLVYRLNAPLLFVNAKRLRDGIRAELRDADQPVQVVLLDLSYTPALDITSVNLLASLRHELEGRGWRCGWAACTPRWSRCWSAAAWPPTSAAPTCTAGSRTPSATPQAEGPVSGLQRPDQLLLAVVAQAGLDDGGVVRLDGLDHPVGGGRAGQQEHGRPPLLELAGDLLDGVVVAADVGQLAGQGAAGRPDGQPGHRHEEQHADQGCLARSPARSMTRSASSGLSRPSTTRCDIASPRGCCGRAMTRGAG